MTKIATFKGVLALLILLATTTLSAQVLWKGNGDGTSWNDAANWKDGAVPTVGALVEFADSTTITGTADAMPGQIKIKGGALVTLDLDLTIGNISEHAIIITSGSQLILGRDGSNRTITLSPLPEKHGINIGASTENSSISIANGTAVTVTQANAGMNIVSPSAIFTNDGTINFNGGKNGLKLAGTGKNNGAINIGAITGKGIQMTGGTFVNNPSGTITATQPGDDGIEIIGGSSFTNHGNINTTAKAGALGGNNGIAVGTAEAAGSFFNMTTGVIIANGGVDSVARPINVLDMGTFSNSGNITCSGGNANSRFYTKGNVTNEVTGVMDMTDGKLNVNAGIFTNNGLIKSVRIGAGASVAEGGTIINNGFYDYAQGSFSGGVGTIQDNGLPANAPIDAAGACTIDLANIAVEWFDGSTSLGLASTDGGLSITDGNALSSNPVTLTTTIPGVAINVTDFCIQEPVDTMPAAISVYKWDGNGDGTSWNDAVNWDNDILPPAGALVELIGTATITGTATDNPAQIKVKSDAVVTLDMNLTIGGDTVQSLVLSPNAQLTLGADGSNRTINLSPNADEHAINIGGGSENATLTIANSTILNLVQAKNGINQVNPTSIITNDGNIAVSNAVKTGFRVSGNFSNNGTISMVEVITKGIQLIGGNFINNPTGNITITTPGDDGIDIINSGTFTNDGSLNLSTKNGATSGNNPINIGTAEESGIFINTPNGLISADGGLDSLARTIQVLEMGSMTNMGQITLSGGNAASRIYIRGNTTNGMGGILDVTDGKVNVNAGSFTNFGLIKSTRTGTGVSTAEGATATNNGFFDYANNNNFAGGQGAVTDNGINLNDATQTTIDAGGMCSVDIAQAGYEWFEEGNAVGTADVEGVLTFTENVLLADSATLTTSIEGVSIQLINVCPEAVFITSIFEPAIEVVKLTAYPTLVSYQNELTVDLSPFESTNMTFDIFNISGQLVHTNELRSGQINQLNISRLQSGIYTLKSRNTTKAMVTRFMVTR